MQMRPASLAGDRAAPHQPFSKIAGAAIRPALGGRRGLNNVSSSQSAALSGELARVSRFHLPGRSGDAATPPATRLAGTASSMAGLTALSEKKRITPTPTLGRLRRPSAVGSPATVHPASARKTACKRLSSQLRMFFNRDAAPCIGVRGDECLGASCPQSFFASRWTAHSL